MTDSAHRAATVLAWSPSPVWPLLWSCKGHIDYPAGDSFSEWHTFTCSLNPLQKNEGWEMLLTLACSHVFSPKLLPLCRSSALSLLETVDRSWQRLSSRTVVRLTCSLGGRAFNFFDDNREIPGHDRNFSTFSVHVNVILNWQKRCTSLWDRYQNKTLFVVDVSINWETDRHWQTKVLGTWKVTKLNRLRQKSGRGHDGFVSRGRSSQQWLPVWKTGGGRWLLLAGGGLSSKLHTTVSQEPISIDCAATLRQKMQVKLAIAPGSNTL